MQPINTTTKRVTPAIKTMSSTWFVRVHFILLINVRYSVADDNWSMIFRSRVRRHVIAST